MSLASSGTSVGHYRLRGVTSLEHLILRPTHRHLVRPSPLVEAIIHRQLLEHAILDRRPPYCRFPVFVAFEYVLQFLLVGFRLRFDDGEGPVGAPEVGKAAIREEGFRGYEELGFIGC